MLENALTYSHKILSEVVHAGDTVIDGTMGNGHDTLFLRNIVGSTGQVYAFDVQQQALITTTNLLAKSDLTTGVQLINDSHSNIDQYIDRPIGGAIFNLGYLPGSDKAVTTHPESTIKAIRSCLNLLKINGRVAVVCYYGHPGGQAELQAVTNFITQLDQHSFTALRYEFINQQNTPPILFVIERRK